jgi:dUTP pyrophosphatase
MNSPVMYVSKTSDNARTPIAGSPHAAGLDLCALSAGDVPPGGREMIGTGLRVAIPSGYYGRIAPRSGLAWMLGIDVMAGVIDSDYRGEVKVLLINHGNLPYNFEAGDRIAQLIVERIAHPRLVLVDTLAETSRGHGGFGSTGAA